MRTSKRRWGSAATRLRRRIAQVASTALALGVVGLAGVVGAAPAAAADPVGCSYGAGGPHAETICWIDFSDFDAGAAAAGQHFTIPLPGDYRADFDLTWENVVGSGTPASRGVPTWSGSVFGRSVYVGVTGEPALTSGNGVIRYTVENISVTDPQGAPVQGYSMLTMDAEAMGSNEGITWNSDQPFRQIGELAETGFGCGVPPGLGTTTVVCNGGVFGAPIVAATDAGWISADVLGGGVQDVVFGFEFSKIELRKVFTELVDPADAVDLTISTPGGTVAGAASTGGALTGTTGGQTVLPVGEFTLTEAVGAGSGMLPSNYDTAWSCTNSATGSDTVLPSGDGMSKTVTPAPGDGIVCTVTNTAKERSLALVKEAGEWTDVNDDGLVDAGDLQHYTFAVTNDGELELHGLEVADPKVGATTCDATTLAPGASTVCRTVQPYTITPADVTAGGVENTATASALPPGSENPAARITTTGSVTTPTTTPAPALSVVKTSDHAEAGAYAPGDVVTYTFAVENTGNVPVLDVGIAEGAFTGTGTLSPAECDEDAARLLPGATVECRATYVLTQEDADGGSVTNTATATATDPDGGAVESEESGTGIEIDAAPAFTFEKIADVGTARSAGDTIAYRFVVTNTGNVTLTEYTVTEGSFSGTNALSAITCPEGPLGAGQKAVCSASYVLSKADVDAGTVTNTASASVVPVRGETPASASSTARAVIPDLLAVTGAMVPWLASTVGLLLLTAGAVLQLRRRRATHA